MRKENPYAGLNHKTGSPFHAAKPNPWLMQQKIMLNSFMKKVTFNVILFRASNYIKKKVSVWGW